MKNLNKITEINKIYLIAPIVVIALALIIGFVALNKKEPSGKIIFKEISHKVNGSKITIKYSVKNDKAVDYKVGTAFVDLLDKNGVIIGGYLLPINETIEKGKTKEYTVENDIVAPREIASLSFRYEETNK